MHCMRYGRFFLNGYQAEAFIKEVDCHAGEE
jgi:hypothetical protein